MGNSRECWNKVCRDCNTGGPLFCRIYSTGPGPSTTAALPINQTEEKNLSNYQNVFFYNNTNDVSVIVSPLSNTLFLKLCQ